MIVKYSARGRKRQITESDKRLELIWNREGSRTTVTATALEDVTLMAAEMELTHVFRREDYFFVNGYQSWTDTREYAFGERLKDVRKIPLPIRRRYGFLSYGEQGWYRCRKNVFHGFDFGYVRGEDPLFVGSFNYCNAYLIIEFCKTENIVRLRSDVEGVELKAGESFLLFDYIVEPGHRDAMERFFAPMEPRTRRKLFGYTSWYNHYQNINEEILCTALEKADKRFELFQIDDGFEPFVGDWLTVNEKKFPRGLEPVVQKIHEKGMMAGIWLAPFAAEKNSTLYREHPDWLAKGKLGKPILAGCNWSGFSPLDLNNPEAVEYVRTVLKTYADWGFDFFKLDFLYAASLVPLKGKSRAQTAEFACGLLRECLGDKLILGCGVGVQNGFGRFDYMRIGPDISLKFDDTAYMRLMHRERISTKVTVQNTIFRSPMDGHAFLNDPDVFLLRDDNISLSKEQRKALTTINALFGSLLMTSDNPGDYDAEKAAMLEKALKLFSRGQVLHYQTVGKIDAVTYILDGEMNTILYDTERGVLLHG